MKKLDFRFRGHE